VLEAGSEQATEHLDMRLDLSVSCQMWLGKRGSGLVQGSACTVLTVCAAESGGGRWHGHGGGAAW